MAWGAALGAIGGAFLSSRASQSNQRSSERLQREFAQKGIQWRVADAEAAGIHPLYALGAQTHSFSPSYVGGTDYAKVGQDIGRAVDVGRTKSERAMANELSIRQQEAALQNQHLQNELLASKIALANQPAQPPAYPGSADPMLIGGQGDTPVIDLPKERIGVHQGQPHAEAGAEADVKWLRTRTGWAPVKSKGAEEGYEDDWLGNLSWNVRNRLVQSMPSSKGEGPPSHVPLKPGHRWVWDSLIWEYRQVPKPTSWKQKARQWLQYRQ